MQFGNSPIAGILSPKSKKNITGLPMLGLLHKIIVDASRW
jgi:hypothetical protein